jgi:outer membrane putative beta-barrel porin/alpha-amylase
MKKATIICFLCFVCCDTNSQELEPRAYAALPKNLNSIVAIYGFSKGNVLEDPALPITDFTITTHSFIGAYVRTFALANKLARIQVATPFVFLGGKLQINGHDTSGSRIGFGDTRIRFGINLLGSPPLERKDFRQYEQKTIFGVSLIASVPTGLYHKDKRINIGSNRFALKPEVGISKRFRKVYLEAYSGVWFFTSNTKYLVDKTLDQNPVFNFQAHAAYYFKIPMWLSFNTTWFRGGKTLVDETSQGDQLDNWRVGATWSWAFAKMQSLKLQFHVGAFTTSSYHYSTVLLGYVYVF